MPLEYHNLYSLNKLQYIKGKRPKVDCIFCAIINRAEEVQKLLVFEGEKTIISVKEQEIQQLLRMSLDALDELYSPSGYNVGYNMGEFAGASLPHLHMHVIPRYPNELGFIDIVGGAKIVVEDPEQTMKNLKKAFRGI